MHKSLKWITPAAAAVALLIGASAMTARAADETAKKTGSVSGTVVDKDGKGVADVEVRLMAGGMQGGRGGRGPGGAGGGEKKPEAAGANGAIGLQDAPPPGGGRGGRGGPPIATAKSDKDGKFEMKDVPVGEYRVGVRDMEKKVYGMAMVKVEEGKTAEVTLKTSDTPPQRGGRPPGGGGGGGGAGGGGNK